MPKIVITRRKVIITLALLVLVVVGVVLFYVPSSPLQKIYQKQSSVEIKTTYKNPFDKGTQYVNPFEKNKNPFVTNR
ncbi:MAG: hypothetical protein A3B41_00240 [Candidatus Levybacteria bacterium RIFCSPLOWO2_01_FULL_37_26]|nr:MAG: hypothetical protein A3E40_03785 [Candidatus Levybacteria bacterium RIFCSPHIGHO2_12_FULL_37_9]OGH39547.1 MAG: hypothetical protein A3B41_00240 [Candidatus Levybacteria bacterium RIFCSPLOWO2_01_FULL_37_26]